MIGVEELMPVIGLAHACRAMQVSRAGVYRRRQRKARRCPEHPGPGHPWR